MAKKIAIVGDGGWGTALALLLHGNGHSVTVWGPFAGYIDSVLQTRENRTFLPGVPLPPEIEWTADRESAVRDADIAVLAVPSKFYAGVMESFVGLVPRECRLVSVAKGLHKDTHERMTAVAERILGSGPVAALSGPSP